MGPAPLPGPRRRPVRGDRATAGASIVTDHIETLHRDGHRARVGRGARGRRRRHRDRPEPARRSAASSSRSTARAVELAEAVAYKGMMLSDVPNLAFTLGYTNASWTLKADLTAEYVCRLLNHMDAAGYGSARRGERPHDRARSRSSTSTPATSLRSIADCPSRARRSRGSCARTTRSTCGCCAAARSTTARCGSPTRRRWLSRRPRSSPRPPDRGRRSSPRPGSSRRTCASPWPPTRRR